jgi:hypothetical protein
LCHIVETIRRGGNGAKLLPLTDGRSASFGCPRPAEVDIFSRVLAADSAACTERKPGQELGADALSFIIYCDINRLSFEWCGTAAPAGAALRCFSRVFFDFFVPDKEGLARELFARDRPRMRRRPSRLARELLLARAHAAHVFDPKDRPPIRRPSAPPRFLGVSCTVTRMTARSPRRWALHMTILEEDLRRPRWRRRGADILVPRLAAFAADLAQDATDGGHDLIR